MMMFITNRRETKARKGEERERWLGKSDRNYSNFGATRTSRKNKQTNRGERATSGGGLDQRETIKIRSQVMLLTQREGWILLKIPRGDIDGVGEDGVTVTSGSHTQKD